MKNLKGYRLFEVQNNAETPKRSERLLTDAQRNYEENKEESQSGPYPTMLFTDVVGSSKMWSEDPQTMNAQIDKHFQLMDGLARKFGGFVVKTIGDAFMIYFSKADDSLEKAIGFAKEVHAKESLPLRIGICHGQMKAKKCKVQNVELLDFFGDVVNTASRMESKVAQPGQIAFTSVTDISEQIESIKKKHQIKEIDGENLPDLKGVTVERAYVMKGK
jgi:class 3 adenylate cyclase